jgi:hypothetical protein
MPKKQIHVVSLTPFEKVEEDTPNEITQDKEENTPDEITQIKEAIKEEEAEIVETPVEATPKPKRKAAAKKKKIIEEYSEQPQAVEPEPEPEIKEETPKKVKTLELVKCDKCNKEMTKRTLRYDHPKTCKGAPINREDIPVQKRVKPPTTQKVVEQTTQLIPNDIIEQEIKKRIQSSIQERMQLKLKQKEERIKKLAEKIA